MMILALNQMQCCYLMMMMSAPRARSEVYVTQPTDSSLLPPVYDLSAGDLLNVDIRYVSHEW